MWLSYILSKFLCCSSNTHLYIEYCLFCFHVVFLDHSSPLSLSPTLPNSLSLSLFLHSIPFNTLLPTLLSFSFFLAILSLSWRRPLSYRNQSESKSLQPATWLKWDFTTIAFLWILRNFKTTFFTEYFRTTTSLQYQKLNLKVIAPRLSIEMT